MQHIHEICFSKKSPLRLSIYNLLTFTKSILPIFGKIYPFAEHTVFLHNLKRIKYIFSSRGVQHNVFLYEQLQSLQACIRIKRYLGCQLQLNYSVIGGPTVATDWLSWLQSPPITWLEENDCRIIWQTLENAQWYILCWHYSTGEKTSQQIQSIVLR